MNNLKELRIKNNISQADIARYLDVSQSLICRFEKGTKDISFSFAGNVAETLNCSLDELAGRKNLSTERKIKLWKMKL